MRRRVAARRGGIRLACLACVATLLVLLSACGDSTESTSPETDQPAAGLNSSASSHKRDRQDAIRREAKSHGHPHGKETSGGSGTKREEPGHPVQHGSQTPVSPDKPASDAKKTGAMEGTRSATVTPVHSSDQERDGEPPASAPAQPSGPSDADDAAVR